MTDYVLLSPLGTTDPTRGFHDGSFIHICRVYRPKKVYLYMSAEICKYDKEDNRYERYLKKLNESLRFSSEVEKIKKEQLVDPDDYDVFYEDFTKIIRKMIEQHPDCEILLNIASGTPQMKAALHVIANLSNRRLIPVQVRSPENKSNEERPVGKHFDFEIEWELNNDNRPDFKNRCKEIKSDNFNAIIKKEIISKHIRAYDYSGALSIAETISDYLPERALKLIKVGMYRLSLETGLAEMHARSVGYMLYPFITRNAYYEQTRIAYEYILNMQVKLHKGELADFLRAISPILTYLFEFYLEKNCEFNIKTYYQETGKNKVVKLARNLLPQELLDVLDKDFRDRYVDSPPSASVLLPILCYKGHVQDAQLAYRLRDVEIKARNAAAHEILAINDNWIYMNAGYHPSEILDMLKELLSICAPIPKDAWNSFDVLNSEIIHEISIS